MFAQRKNNQLRQFLRHKANTAAHPYFAIEAINYGRLPEVVEIFNTSKMYQMLERHERKDNLYRNHKRYIDFLGDTAGFLSLATLDTSIFEGLESLRVKFPNFSSAIDFYKEQFALSLLTDDKAFSATPLLISGPPGIGKTAFCHALAKLVSTHFELISMSTVTAGFVLGGMSSSWADGKPGKVVEALARGKKANPLIVIDEIDKASGNAKFDPLGSLYQLLEKETSSVFIDEGLEIATNCALIVWIATANYPEKIAEPILSRFTVIDVAAPQDDHMKQVLASIYSNIRKNHSWGDKLSETLSVSVIDKIISSSLEPRLVQQALIRACGKAVLRSDPKAAGDLFEIIADDLELPKRQSVKRSKQSTRQDLIVPPVFTMPAMKDGSAEVETICLWSIREVICEGSSRKTRHLIGFLPNTGFGRVTSAIQSFDRKSQTITTGSGRTYYLVGPPGINDDAAYVWDHWKDANSVSSDSEVTSQYCLLN